MELIVRIFLTMVNQVKNLQVAVLLFFCLGLSPAVSETLDTGLLTEQHIQEIKSQCGLAVGEKVMIPTWLPDGWALVDVKYFPDYGYELIYSGGVTQITVMGRQDKGRGGDAHPAWDGTIPYTSSTFGAAVMGYLTEENSGYNFSSGWLTEGPGMPVYMLNGVFRQHATDNEAQVVKLAESLKLLRL